MTSRSVALDEIIVDGDDVAGAPFERCEIACERCDDGFAFAGFHFGDLALAEDHGTDELDIEWA